MSIPEYDSRVLRWLAADARDDFLPDYLRYRDIAMHEGPWRRSASEKELPFEVPKNPLFARAAVWLPPTTRLRYLTAVLPLLAELSHIQNDRCYSYRVEEGVVPPFPHVVSDWLRFQRDYKAALARSHGWSVCADVASYFEHLVPANVVSRIAGMLPRDVRGRVTPWLRNVLAVLEQVSHAGIPQNNEASSFLASVYLAEIDRALGSYEEVQYFRYQDDIRIVAPSRLLAIAACRRVQELLRERRLFLNSSKTQLVAPESDEWLRQVDLAGDEQLSEIDSMLSTGAVAEGLVRRLLLSFEEAAAKGAGARVKAIGARLFAIRSEGGWSLMDDVLVRVGLRGFEELPQFSDYWFRVLQSCMNEDVAARVLRALESDGGFQGAWVRFWLLNLLATSPVVVGGAVSTAASVMELTSDPSLASAAVVVVARHGRAVDAERLVELAGRSGLPLQVRRALLFSRWFLRAKSRALIVDKVDDSSSPVRSAMLANAKHVRASWLFSWPPVTFPAPASLMEGMLGNELRVIRSPLGSADYE
ncbi:MAG: RNA-directed DNA polymerase [Myxococcaceae bacterium]|nr:RNA-directed DNA polymerase [Myxococcaceae bacterium]